VTKHSERIKQHAKAIAEDAHRPYIHINGRIRKGHIARQIDERDNITDDLICVLSAMKSAKALNWPMETIDPS